MPLPPAAAAGGDVLALVFASQRNRASSLLSKANGSCADKKPENVRKLYTCGQLSVMRGESTPLGLRPGGWHDRVADGKGAADG